MTSPRVVRWSALLGGLVLIVGLRLAPALTGRWVTVVSLVWVAVLAWLLVLAFRVLGAMIGRAGAVVLLLAGVALPFLLTAVRFAPSVAVRLPCPRNWTNLTTWMLRPSPMASASVELGGTRVKVCYGRPAARGRTMLGGSHVPFGRLWRTGANEPTTIIATGPLSVAGIEIPAGRSSLYSVPGPETWEIVLNSSTTQWGIESEYESVRATEIARAIVRAEAGRPHRERFTLSFTAPAGDSATMVLEWETVRVGVPVAARPFR